jgi:hypothetical protein
MANEVQIEISLEEKQALDALTKLIKKTDQFTDEFQQNAKKSSGAWDSFVGNLGAIAASKALSVVTDSAKFLFNTFIVDGVKAAQVQEDAINKLNSALKITGFDVDKASKEFQKFATELQQTTKFGDELIIENIALLQSLGNLSEQGLKDGTKAALDLSAALGISLDSAITLVGKAAAGEVGSFSRYGVQIKKGSDNAETFANTLTALNSKFGGSAEAQVNTYSGRVTQLSNAFGDLQEEFGKLVTENQDVSDAIKLLSDGIVSFSKTIIQDGPKVVSTLKDIADIFLITPAKFWSDLFGGGETRNELEVLSTALDKTSIKIKEINKFLAEQPRGGSLDGTFTTKEEALRKLGALIDKEQELLNKRNSLTKEGGSEFVGPTQAAGELTKKQDPASSVDVQFEKDKIALINQLKSEQAVLDAENKILKEETEFADNETKLLNIEAQIISENEIKANLDAEKLASEAKTQQDLQAIRAKSYADSLAKDKVFTQKQIADQKLANDVKLQAANNFLTAGASLAKEGSVVQKALLTSQAVMNTYAAANNALATPAPYPLPAIFAASTIALGLANVAKINGVGFQTGGFVGGNSIAGDQNVIRANSDEFVMTRAMQRNTLEAVANGGASGQNNSNISMMIERAFSQPIIVQIDNKEIARATREAINDGMRI